MAEMQKPDYIFETSWEVCNMVGGIYTVLSTRAATLQQEFSDKLIFIGPDVWRTSPCPVFVEDKSLFTGWDVHVLDSCGLKIRIGRWTIPGNPIAILVDFLPLFPRKNEIYGKIWEIAGVNSMAAYGDYDESSMFGYATGLLIESFYRYFDLSSYRVAAHFNEWMTTFGAFYIHHHCPDIATLFTTHATSIGRSIAGNNKPLYDYLHEYNGDQMAYELNMVSKHSTEKMAAHQVDCFTTVSEITARECEQLLEKMPHVVTPNGFEDDFVPKGNDHIRKRTLARNRLRQVAETLLGYTLSDDVSFICTAGRYEYKNKGIDTYLESLRQIADSGRLKKDLVAFIMVPAYTAGARMDLIAALENKEPMDSANRFSTHDLHDYYNDQVMGAIHWYHFRNAQTDRLKVIFVPAYLNGTDAVFNMPYYDLLIGMDLTVFPSYYEPWGYTPLESVAFSVPTITTNLSGFGLWAAHEPQDIDHGVGVIHRSDYNAYHVSEYIADMICRYVDYSLEQRDKIRHKAFEISQNALWDKFIGYYYQSYHIAFCNRDSRLERKG